MRPSPPASCGAIRTKSAVYSVMQADVIEVTRSGAELGEITSRGRLVDAAGRKLAGFVQRTQVWQGSRLIRVDVELEPLEEVRADPWNSYYAARFAWPDQAAVLSRGIHAGRHPTDAKRIEAPEYIDIAAPRGRTTILTRGLPFHRRSATRIIDSLLVVRGETARRFQLAIGIDLANPAAAAAELLAPQTAWQQTMRPPAGPAAGWLFHVDARQVLATHWAPLGPADGPEDSGGGPCGFSLRAARDERRSGACHGARLPAAGHRPQSGLPRPAVGRSGGGGRPPGVRPGRQRVGPDRSPLVARPLSATVCRQRRRGRITAELQSSGVTIVGGLGLLGVIIARGTRLDRLLAKA